MLDMSCNIAWGPARDRNQSARFIAAQINVAFMVFDDKPTPNADLDAAR